MIRINDLYGKIHSVEATYSDSVLDVKRAYLSGRGRDPSTLSLFWKGQHLEDDRSLNDYSIPQGSTLYSSYRMNPVYHPGYQIFVKTLKNNTCSLYVTPADTIASLKGQLSPYMENAPPEEIRLIFTGQQLEDTRCLADYPIMKESTLMTVLRLRGGAPTPWSAKPKEQANTEDVELF